MPMRHAFAESLTQLLAARAFQCGGRVAYRFLARDADGDPSITYGELHERAQRVAASLQAAGLRGERVLLYVGTSVDFLVSFFGILLAGAVAVPLSPPHLSRALARSESIVRNAGARMAIVPGTMLKRFVQLQASNEAFAALQLTTPDELAAGTSGRCIDATASSESLAVLQYTSGSTATPKGVCISHGNFLHNAAMISRAMGLSERTVGVSWLPLHHDMGLMTGVIGPLFNGCLMTLMPASAFVSDPLAWLKALTRQRATVTGAPNFAYELCLEKVLPEQLADLDLSSLEVAFCGAETVCADTLTRFASRFEACGFRSRSFFPCYGLAEATLMVSGGPAGEAARFVTVATSALGQGRVAAPRADEPAQRLVSCGQALAGLDVAIVDTDTLRPCPADRVGEVWVRGSSVARGYWGLPSETEAVFNARMAGEGGAGFLRTGDLGFVRDGELTIVGRLKELIVICGVNHHPQDIEATVETCHPAIGRHAGVALPLEENGRESLLIVQEIKRTWRSDPQPVLDAIMAEVAQRHGIRPAVVVLVSHGSLPRTTSGKLQRCVARAAHLGGRLDVVARSDVPAPGPGPLHPQPVAA
ncbi:fatty acyl-AMP ligase [Rhizobacter sp. Root16D2]|nr:fatty acyl-AMP ligase [Rhizobacter sp. Root16D2]